LRNTGRPLTTRWSWSRDGMEARCKSRKLWTDRASKMSTESTEAALCETRYRNALSAYVQQEMEDALMDAFELGRKALAEGTDCSTWSRSTIRFWLH